MYMIPMMTLETNIQSMNESNKINLKPLIERMNLVESKLKEVVNPPRPWSDNDHSNLIQENLELKRENQNMKMRLAELEEQLHSMTIKLPGLRHPMPVPTHNTFDSLADDSHFEKELES
jgi:hypothetical protein